MPRLGPGPGSAVATAAGYRVELQVAPNAGGRRENSFVVRTSRAGLRLRERAAGVASGTGVTLTMPGVWQLAVAVRPDDAAAFTVRLTDVVRL